MSEVELELSYTTRTDWDSRAVTEAELSWATERLSALAKHVTPNPEKPCAYQPWIDAFAQLRIHPDVIMGLADRVGAHKWADPQVARAEFVLTFLEVDVMQFRSGYAKERMIRRLKQSNISAHHMPRVDELLRHVVMTGTGREYRAYCALAAKCVPVGLQSWLHGHATKARLHIKHVRSQDLQIPYANLTETDAIDFIQGNNTLNSNLSDPQPRGTREFFNSREQRVARNAWQMLRRIQRSKANEPYLQLPI